MKKVTFTLLFFSLIIVSKPLFGQIDVNITDLENDETVSFGDIFETYDLDKELPTIVITWSGKWCFPCISLINRYLDCDMSMMNLITINVDNEENRDEVLNEGYHDEWRKALNFHANIGEDEKGFDNVFNVSSAPLILYLVDGNISDALVSYSVYPYRMIQTGRIDDINFVWDSAKDLNSLAWAYYQNEDDESKLEEAKEWVIRSIELNKNYSNTDTYAALLFKTGDYTKSLKVAKEAIEIAKENDEDYSTTTDLINSVIEKL